MAGEYNLQEVIDGDVLPTFIGESIISKFATKDIGDSGQYRYTRRQAMAGKEPAMSEYLKELLTDTYRVEDGTFQFPHVGKRIMMTTDQYKRYNKVGAMVPNNQNTGSLLAIAVDKRQVWQDPPATGKGSEMTGKHYGLTNAGAGTVARPSIIADPGPNAAWTTANQAMLDLQEVANALIMAGFNKDTLALFYPIQAQASVGIFNLVTGGVEGTIIEYAKKLFPAGVYPVGNDNAATPACLLLGNVETAANFPIVGIDMSSVIYVYNKAAQARLHKSEDDNMWYYDVEAQGAMVPYKVRNIGGTLYKGVCMMDACGT